jgi:hypothetical protein
MAVALLPGAGSGRCGAEWGMPLASGLTWRMRRTQVLGVSSWLHHSRRQRHTQEQQPPQEQMQQRQDVSFLQQD